MYRAKTQHVLYGVLCTLFLVSLGLFGWAFVAESGSAPWRLLAGGYLLLLVAHTWYLFGLLWLGGLRRPAYPAYANEEIAVVIPCYNEEPALLGHCLASVLAARGTTRVIVVDDGSTNGVEGDLARWETEHGIAVHSLPENRGKRAALHLAVKQLPESVEFVVTIDSDTVLDPDALVRIVEPLKAAGIAAATGDVRVLNERRNALTRMQAAYYWVGLNIYKAAQSSIGSVVCCSGCLAAYRAGVLRGVIDEFFAQKFLGEPCTHSEDRHLTNLVLKEGHEVVYVPEAVSFTETPHRLGDFLRQQRRWKRGFIRESIYTLTHAWQKKRLLFCQILLWDLSEPFVTIGLRLAAVDVLVTDPAFFLKTIVPAWLLVGCVRNVFLLLESPRLIPGLVGYMFLYELLLYWVNVQALFSVKHTGWLSRRAAPLEEQAEFSSAVV